METEMPVHSTKGTSGLGRQLFLNPVTPTLAYINVYVTKARIYVIGCSQEPPGGEDAFFRVLKIDRTVPERLDITDDGVNYNKKQIEELLLMIDAGSGEKGTVLEDRISAYGILGMVRFLQGYYMILITKRRKVGLIGKHHLFKIEDTVMIAISSSNKGQQHPLETRYIRAFQNVDITSNFYFSYTYDLTRPLQANMHTPSASEMLDRTPNCHHPVNPDMEFVWNGYLIESLIANGPTPWAMYVIHGFLTQSNLQVFGRSIYVTLIARRSCKFAGTRFLKRGTNAEGNPANHVETEQIVHDSSTLDHKSGLYTSFIQARASIPCFWSQDFAKQNIKPPVQIDRRDPFASAAALHFDSFLRRYGPPIIVLDLVKKKEKRPRESILSNELADTIEYLNQFVPPHFLQHITWDMHRTAKSKGGNVLRKLEEIARRGMMQTGFFHAGPELASNQLRSRDIADAVGGIPYSPSRLGRNQKGVLRVNCVDCLDRTNTAQFMLGLCALQHQLYAIGVLEAPSQLNFDSGAFHVLAELYEDQGDTLALQYGGSQLVNRIQTYRKSSPWTTHSRDILNTVARYYSNSFTDAEKQEAMNLFLGKYIPGNSGENLWKLETDLFLHFPHIKTGDSEPVADYQNWCSVDENWTAEIDRFEPLPSPEELQAIHSDIVLDQRPRASSVLSGVTHSLPSLKIFNCHDIEQLKTKIIEFYKPGTGDIVTAEGLQELHHLQLDASFVQVRNLLNYLFGTTDLTAEQLASEVSTAVLANAINAFSPEKTNYFMVLNPGADRLDYVEIRQVLVDHTDYTRSDFDNEVKDIVRGWHHKSRSAEDCNVAALLIARKQGFHFLPQTILPKINVSRTEHNRACNMFENFYGRTRLTVFEQLYSLNMDSSARLQGPSSRGSPFAVLREEDLGSHKGEGTLKTAPTLDVGLEVDSDEEGDDGSTAVTDETLMWYTKSNKSNTSFKARATNTLEITSRRRKTLSGHGESTNDGSFFLPSSKEAYGLEPRFVRLVRPNISEVTKYNNFVDIGGFLEGHDMFYQASMNQSTEANSKRDLNISGGVHVSTARSRDHQPVVNKSKLSTMSRYPNIEEALGRVSKHVPTAFEAVSSLAQYEAYVSGINSMKHELVLDHVSSSTV